MNQFELEAMLDELEKIAQIPTGSTPVTKKRLKQALKNVGTIGAGMFLGSAAAGLLDKLVLNKMLKQPLPPVAKAVVLGGLGAGAAMAGSSMLAQAHLLTDKSEKTAGMPFLKQERPDKVKEIYKALKRDHPDMPAEMKARIAARQGKPGKQKQGPPYKGPIKTANYEQKEIEYVRQHGDLPDAATRMKWRKQDGPEVYSAYMRKVERANKLMKARASKRPKGRTLKGLYQVKRK